MVSLVLGQTSIFSLASFHRLGMRRTTSRGRGHNVRLSSQLVESLNDSVVDLFRGDALCGAPVGERG